MATDSILGGLFGINPQSYERQLSEQGLAEGAQLGQMSPDAFGRSMLYAGGAQLGRGIGGALGGQDPQLQLISQRNALAQQFDTSTTQGLAGLASALRERNDVAGATQVAQALMTARQKEGELAAKMREHLSPNQKDAAGIADSQYSRNDPKWMETYGTELSRLTTKEFAPSIDKVGVAESTREPVYFDKKANEQFIMKPDASGKMVRVPFSGGIDQTTSRTNLSVSQKQEEEFSKRRGFKQADALDEATALARGGSLALNSIGAMKEQNATGQLFTGPLANSYVGATNLLASLNLLSKDQTAKLTSSQVYDKSAKDLVMQDLGGKLGAQISDADRKFVEDRIPQLTTSEKARTELLNKMEEIQRGKIDYYKKMNSHANKYGNLNDFDFSEKYSGNLTAPSNKPSAGGWSIKPKQP